MYIFFLDEAGNSRNHADPDQPFLVWSAIGFNLQDLGGVYSIIEKGYEDYWLGHGNAVREIKAHNVIQGRNCDNDQRDFFRRLFLGPCVDNAVVFSVVIDKEAQRGRYRYVHNPLLLGLHYIFERISNFLEYGQNVQNRDGVCIAVIDQDGRNEGSALKMIDSLKRRGKRGLVTYGDIAYSTFPQSFDSIQDVYVVDSQYCFGVQIADFHASYMYQIMRGNTFGGYSNEYARALTRNMYTVNNNVLGHGLKVFPEDNIQRMLDLLFLG